MGLRNAKEKKRMMVQANRKEHIEWIMDCGK